MIAVYCKCPQLLEQLRPPLCGVEVAWAEAWNHFVALLSDAEAGVYCTPDYTLDDLTRLRRSSAPPSAGPPA